MPVHAFTAHWSLESLILHVTFWSIGPSRHRYRLDFILLPFFYDFYIYIYSCTYTNTNRAEITSANPQPSATPPAKISFTQSKFSHATTRLSCSFLATADNSTSLTTRQLLLHMLQDKKNRSVRLRNYSKRAADEGSVNLLRKLAGLREE